MGPTGLNGSAPLIDSGELLRRFLAVGHFKLLQPAQNASAIGAGQTTKLLKNF
jgi:hypothetical protein